MKKISVIVPIYNVEKYLRRCLDSLLAQTMKDFELILINDGSTDSSGSICREYQKKAPQLIKYYEKANGGLSDARNYGMRFATGEYLLFIDSDDYVETQMLENMYALTKNGSKKIVECNFVWEFKDFSKKDKGRAYNSLSEYLVKGRVVAWNKLYRRDWLFDTGVLFPYGKLYEDQVFFFETAAFLNNISEVASDFNYEVHYTQRSSSISYNETNRIIEIFWIYEDIIAFYKAKKIYARFEQELEYRFCRNLLGNVLLRKAIKIKDKNLRRRLLDQIWRKVHEWFPNWKRNCYLHKHDRVNYYLRALNRFWYQIFYFI
ncbi:glycosyltransferase family 2 protein [Liquorilactobacillus oeni]|uniref:Glycosyltransferase n=1 Tax=Liquorilactobacillus oeni DSM 19972 TaxID=1423777 RepID=A0A0R1MIR3_9LACO|nr:glycosyltransferase family A protein [Liquorilactobacillus oeni]KRL05066.1 glycosyltransferase [Liquorilactobacillus oeni DSM 19972]